MVRYIWAPYRALELALLERYSEKYSAWATAAESTDREVVHLIFNNDDDDDDDGNADDDDDDG